MELQISGLTKEYRKGNRAVDAISLNLDNGMFGLLGPNGAGKTTLMKMLATLLEPTSGSVMYDELKLGQENQDIRRRLGYLPQDYGLYPSLTARELLGYMATLYGMPKADIRKVSINQVLELVNLSDAADQKVGGFSGGMRQRLGIAQALLNNPDLLIVDEPTAGLDPEERIRFRNLLGQLSQNRIVILSTHIVGDIGSSCEYMAVLDRGRVRFLGNPSELIEKARGHVWMATLPVDKTSEAHKNHKVISVVRMANGMNLRLLGEEEFVNHLPGLSSVEPTLEDAYIWLMQDRQMELVQ